MSTSTELHNYEHNIYSMRIMHKKYQIIEEQ